VGSGVEAGLAGLAVPGLAVGCSVFSLASKPSLWMLSAI